MIGMAALLAVAAAPLIESTLPGIEIPVVVGGDSFDSDGPASTWHDNTSVTRYLGTLPVLSGFEILYAAMEGSSPVAALLVVINLGLGLVGHICSLPHLRST